MPVTLACLPNLYWPSFESRFKASNCASHSCVKLTLLRTVRSVLTGDGADGLIVQAKQFLLPPGRHTFHVIACNGDGTWNETGAPLSFYRSCALSNGLVKLVFRHRCPHVDLVASYPTAKTGDQSDASADRRTAGGTRTDRSRTARYSYSKCGWIDAARSDRSE